MRIPCMNNFEIKVSIFIRENVILMHENVIFMYENEISYELRRMRTQ